MRYRGRPVLGAISGLLFGLFLALELVFFKVVGSGSPVLVALPVVFFVLGIVGGLTGPLGRGRVAARAGAGAGAGAGLGAPVPPPPAPPPPAPVEPAPPVE